MGPFGLRLVHSLLSSPIVQCRFGEYRRCRSRKTKSDSLIEGYTHQSRDASNNGVSLWVGVQRVGYITDLPVTMVPELLELVANFIVPAEHDVLIDTVQRVKWTVVLGFDATAQRRACAFKASAQHLARTRRINLSIGIWILWLPLKERSCLSDPTRPAPERSIHYDNWIPDLGGKCVVN
jgi:hypothetical protein